MAASAAISPMAIQKFEGSSKNGELEVHPHHAGEDDRREEHRRQDGKDLHHRAVALRFAAHEHVVGPEQRLPGLLDRVDGALEALEHARPGTTELLVEREVGTGQDREGLAMWRERLAHPADAAAHGHELREHVVATPVAERRVVERVDVGLDAFDDPVVADDRGIDDRAHEPAGVERPEVRLALDALEDPVDRRDGTVVDGQDPVATRDDVERLGIAVIVVRAAVQGPDRQMDVVRVLDQLRARADVHESMQEARRQVQMPSEEGDLLGIASVKVDPDEAPLA